MRIDLHSHSSASDGTDPPAEVVRRARHAGLDVLALTDHDTVDGVAEAGAALPADLVLVPGCELSCATEVAGRRVSVHLLAYLFDPHEPVLAAELAALRGDRAQRARAMVATLQALGAAVEWADVEAVAGDAPVGRPHIARALADRGVVPDVASAFTPEWIAYGGRAYVAKRALEPAAAVGLVVAAGGVAVLAHPGAHERGGSLPDRQVAALAEAGMAGIEVDHPDHQPSDRRRLHELARELDLIVTGASDDHGALTGRRLGCETTSERSYATLLSRARGAEPIHR